MHTLWFESALLPGGWCENVRIAIAGGLIESVEVRPAEALDERHSIGIPGLCNVHSHGFQRGMAGLSESRGGDADDFWSWRTLMYRFLDRMGPEDVASVCALTYAEMLESGYTRVGEFHYLHNDPDGHRYADPAVMAAAVVEASASAGIGLTLLPVFYAHADFGGAPAADGQRRFLSDPDNFSRLLDACRAIVPADANLGVAPHSLRAVTPEELHLVISLSEGGPIHIHAAEQLREVEACLAWSGARPVEWLLANAGVDPRWCLIHATHISAEECGALAASGAVAGLCPITEANLGDGIFPAQDYLGRNGTFAIGTDSNIFIDAAAEMGMIEYGQRLQRRRRNILSGAQPSIGRTLFDGALGGGAQALGVTAGLRAGAPADIVALDASHPSLVARTGDALLDSWIFAAGRDAVDCVWRGGRKLVAAGRHIDRTALVRRYTRTLQALLG